MKSSTKTYHSALRLIHRFRQNQKLSRLRFVIIGGMIWSLGAGFLFCVLEILFRFRPFGRLIMISIFIGISVTAAFLAGLHFFSLIFRKGVPSDDDIAIRIGAGEDSIKDRLVDALQVVRQDGSETGTSDILAAVSLERVLEETHHIDPTQGFGEERRPRRLAFLAGLICFCTMAWFLPSGRSAINRLVHPSVDFPIPFTFNLVVSPGDTTVVRGEDVTIVVDGAGAVPKELILVLDEQGVGIREYRLKQPFTYALSNVRNDVRYSVYCGRYRTSTYNLRVLERPMVRSMQVAIYPPSYARLETRFLEQNIGSIDALRGSRIGVDVTASKPLSEAIISFDAMKPLQAGVDGIRASGEFHVREPDRYRIELLDTIGIMNDNPISFPIHIIPDASPVARIVAPACDVDLDETMALSLVLSAEDDYGLSTASLVYVILTDGYETVSGDTQVSPIVLPRKEPAILFKEQVWELESLDLLPEDVVTYCFEVEDNDRVSGPKRARSRWFRARFPSIYEIFEEAEAEHEHQIADLEMIAEESRELRDALNRISEEMKGGEDSGWEERKSLEEMGRKQQQMLEEVDSLKTRLEELTDRLDRNDLISLETLEKYEELQHLYQEMASPELLEAMERMQEAMDRLSEEALKNASERFQHTQENFLKSIERTISLLKRIQVEQKVDEIVNRIDDLLQRQQGINASLTDGEDLDMLAEKEKSLSDDTGELDASLEDLYRKMEELSGMPMNALSAVMDEMDRRGLPQQIDRASEAMRAGNRETASMQGEGSEQTLTSMKEMMQTLQKNLQNRQREKVARAMRRASLRLLQLSRGEESLMQGSSGGRVTSTEAARRQQSLMAGLSSVVDSLVQLSEQTFFITPEMGRALGEAQAQMGRALHNMTEGGRGTAGHQAEAMGALNRSVMAIQDALGRIEGAGSGLGMEAFMLQLEQMGLEQIRINQQMMDMLNQGQLSLEQQAAMARLAAEQEALKRALEDAIGQYRRASDIPGRLDNLVGEMEEIVYEMRQHGARHETLRRQERILSRLLDAQRSVRQRDTSRKRRAEAGEDVRRESPADFQQNTVAWRERIRRDILRLAKEGYTQEYQELIRKYFETLTTEKR